MYALFASSSAVLYHTAARFLVSVVVVDVAVAVVVVVVAAGLDFSEAHCVSTTKLRGRTMGK